MVIKIKELNLDTSSISKLYWNQEKSLPEIGEIYKVNSGTLYRWVKRALRGN